MFKNIFKNKFFTNYSTLFWLWMLLPIIAWVKNFSHINNNFLIFRHVFWNTIDQQPLYQEYPQFYYDINHYGPLFSLIVAPAAILPPIYGSLIWLVGLSLFLYIAIRKLPATQKQRIFIYWFCAHELLTALFMSQFNVAIAAIIILTFALIEKKKDFWAAFFIMLGTMTKIYGIVGLAFFFFSKNKSKFILSCVGWGVAMFVLPMLISSPEFIINQHYSWINDIISKNGENQFSFMQNISLLGMIRKISGVSTYSDLIPISIGLILFAIPYLRVNQYKNLPFRQTLLASVLMFTVLFSTGSESSGYVIALTGVAIWYTVAPWKRGGWDIFLMIFAFILTSMSPSDIFPAYLRLNYVIPYSLKALPCAIIWFKLCYEMISRDYANPQIDIGNDKEAV